MTSWIAALVLGAAPRRVWPGALRAISAVLDVLVTGHALGVSADYPLTKFESLETVRRGIEYELPALTGRAARPLQRPN